MCSANMGSDTDCGRNPLSFRGLPRNLRARLGGPRGDTTMGIATCASALPKS